MVPPAPGPGRAAWDDYRAAVTRLATEYLALPEGERVRLAKRTSNLFRARLREHRAALDVAAFDGLIDVDPEARTADVGAMTTYEHLVDATLPYGLVPLVVPELKTITVGGAVTGLGIESSSWRAGMPHESMLELDILTGEGKVVTATPDGPHRDLFYGFPNSYGTLGYALRVKIELEPVKPWVQLRHLRFSRVDELVETMAEVCEAGALGGRDVDFVDATMFDPDECYLTLGSWTEHPGPVSDYTGQEIYYRSIQIKQEDWLTARSYLWRWDTDWFWCSRAFHVQRPWVRRLVNPRRLRSDTYWRIVALERRFHVKQHIDLLLGRPDREYVIQDVEVPAGRLAEFLTNFQKVVPIAPLWLCPLRQRDPGVRWPLYPLDPKELYVNVGFWSTCPLQPGMDRLHHNRWIEDEVARLGGLKSLYSTAFYEEDKFWSIYSGADYERLKARYDPGSRLLDLYAKCVQAR